MADLVLTDSALASLKSALSASLKDLEAVQKSSNHFDDSPLGAASVMAAQGLYEFARGGDLMAAGTAISDLLKQVDFVEQRMTEADLRLGSDAHHVVAE